MDSRVFSNLPDLEQELLDLVGQLPAGRVATYGTLAAALGNPVAARWVGHFLLHHDHSDDCPCHRVVRAGGELGQYIAGGPEAKARRLVGEAVQVAGGAVDLSRYGFDRFRSNRPLERLKQVQEQIVAGISLRPLRSTPRLIAGVDVSYTTSGDGVAAYVLIDLETTELLWATTVRRRTRFPYITSYLSFREIPLLLDLLGKARVAGRLAELLLVDGSGILHPRRAGIASHLGVAGSIPTVGVTKKLLCGQVDLKDLAPLESRCVLHDGAARGVAIRPTAGSLRPIFVSPGHRVDLSMAEAVVRRLLRGHRLPEPLYRADRLSRAAARSESQEMPRQGGQGREHGFL